jgi:hypothetical protein
MRYLKPDRQKYEEFKDQLSRSSKSNTESGLMVFLALLFLVPIIIAGMFYLLYLLTG